MFWEERGVCLQILSPFDSVQENVEAIAILPDSMPGPLGVLGAPKVTFWMGHQGKNTPRGIANASDILYRTVRVIGIAGFVVAVLVGVIESYI